MITPKHKKWCVSETGVSAEDVSRVSSGAYQVESPDTTPESVHLTPKAPSPVPFYGASPFSQALQKMHNEIKKYEGQREHIVRFVELAPFVRDFHMIREELEFLLKEYIPGCQSEGVEPEMALNTLENLLHELSESLEERRGFKPALRSPPVSEEIQAAEFLLREDRAKEAIKDYKRVYYIVQSALEREIPAFHRNERAYITAWYEYPSSFFCFTSPLYNSRSTGDGQEDQTTPSLGCPDERAGMWFSRKPLSNKDSCSAQFMGHPVYVEPEKELFPVEEQVKNDPKIMNEKEMSCLVYKSK
ncbi:uncharacterized protein CDAR_464041 [Caerostris darwini]|uniref:Uncharacterized protein n=1 Tax=Caerostris darwini TaxID=1538125 RepID=A0AAV4VW42_9ARAC|nr:uncharacterized protein CDAR_464041 [Caerostris darwini]